VRKPLRTIQHESPLVQRGFGGSTRTIKRKALLFAILTEVILVAALYLSFNHSYALMLAIRILHMPASALYWGIADMLGLSWESDCLGTALVFCFQTFVWYLRYRCFRRKLPRAKVG
jgi:hypothetical protein